MEHVEVFEFEKFFEVTAVNISQESADKTVTDDISDNLYIAENRRHECPRLLINILDQEIFGLIDWSRLTHTHTHTHTHKSRVLSHFISFRVNVGRKRSCV